MAVEGERKRKEKIEKCSGDEDGWSVEEAQLLRRLRLRGGHGLFMNMNLRGAASVAAQYTQLNQSTMQVHVPAASIFIIPYACKHL